MNNKNLLLCGAVAVGAYLLYKQVSKPAGVGDDLLVPPPGETIAADGKVLGGLGENFDAYDAAPYQYRRDVINDMQGLGATFVSKPALTMIAKAKQAAAAKAAAKAAILQTNDPAAAAAKQAAADKAALVKQSNADKAAAKQAAAKQAAANKAALAKQSNADKAAAKQAAADKAAALKRAAADKAAAALLAKITAAATTKALAAIRKADALQAQATKKEGTPAGIPAQQAADAAFHEANIAMQLAKDLSVKLQAAEQKYQQSAYAAYGLTPPIIYGATVAAAESAASGSVTAPPSISQPPAVSTYEASVARNNNEMHVRRPQDSTYDATKAAAEQASMSRASDDSGYGTTSNTDYESSPNAAPPLPENITSVQTPSADVAPAEVPATDTKAGDSKVGMVVGGGILAAIAAAVMSK